MIDMDYTQTASCFAEDIYSIRTFNSSDDIIKFDGVEWLSRRETVENEITNVLSIIDLDIRNTEQDNNRCKTK